MPESIAKKYLMEKIAAISCLSNSHPKCSLSVLTLIYCGMDQFAWLNTHEKKHGLPEFKTWVEKYLLIEPGLDCTAEELWAARNGVVHMGTSESVNTRNGVTKLGYSYGPEKAKSHIDGHKIISIDLLMQAFCVASMNFIADLESDISKREVAETKIKQVLIVQ